MKKSLVFFLSLVFIFSNIHAQKDKGNPMSYAFTASYSSQFDFGNKAYSKIVLDAWKAYDNNTLDAIADYISDTINVILADGNVVKGKTEFMNAIKGYRGTFPSVKSTVEAWIPVNSLDRNQQWVCIWGTEADTKSDGTTQTIALHELWRFNSAGKVDFLRQFIQQLPK